MRESGRAAVLAVRNLRVATGDSQQAFAQRLGLSIRSVANYEKGRVPEPRSMYRLAKLARQLNLPHLEVVFTVALDEELNT